MIQLDAIERLATAAARWGGVDVLARVEGMPIHAVRLGPAEPTAPAFLVVGGVHGTEPLGTAVAVAYLQTLVAQLAWDGVLHAALERCRILIVPLLNPIGMARGTRANGNGVDLMRNAPAHPAGGTPLVGGQRLSSRLPWYMGAEDAPMQPEAAALVAFVERELFRAPFALALDVHSGFGLVDRLWYPYARTRVPMADLPAVEALARLLDETLPNHVYRVEPIARVYTIRGDLWDHLYDRRRAAGPGLLLPFTLEIGSWRPRDHRRTLRRHLPLLDFLFRAAVSWRP